MSQPLDNRDDRKCGKLCDSIFAKDSVKRKYKPKKKIISDEIFNDSEKYLRGLPVDPTGVETKFFKEKLKQKEINLEYTAEQTSRTDVLLCEEQGFIKADNGEITAEYKQREIARNVDIQSAAKYFRLNLDFGPYVLRYTNNGRHLLLGGRRGHVATFDWITKKLNCEINVMEEIVDVSWLHVHTLFACAQKDWVYIYDNQGTEIHCVKRLYRVNRMEFLPYHFLLATANRDGYLSWLDVSIGELVGNYNTYLGEIHLMRNNPSNGVLCIGDGKGVVSMWSPKVRKPLIKLLCHPTPMTALTVDFKGKNIVTAGLDRKVKVWDIRILKYPLVTYNLHLPAKQVEVSQKDVLAFSMRNSCEIYKHLILSENSNTPYLRVRCGGYVHSMRFCPYEDILGIATEKGFQSLLTPGSGEPNFDAVEDNPFQTKSQLREHEVHSILDKIPAQLITLDPNDIVNVNIPSLQEKIDNKLKLFDVKSQVHSTSTKLKRNGSKNVTRNKQIIKEQNRKKFTEQIRRTKKEAVEKYKVIND
ncbi:WD repeat-containing protein 46 [Teleopsis dalmanni]|uniref:WD repeat-containing protein 46 n=1 Tax=Teleopsis dalmanni TaxID=139649 RepID=UPI000D32B5B0|nr:WD repeat-containing protein 46 [Teleopsis dalmanni]